MPGACRILAGSAVLAGWWPGCLDGVRLGAAGSGSSGDRTVSGVNLADRVQVEPVGPLLHEQEDQLVPVGQPVPDRLRQDRKSTRLNSSHVKNSYAVFCLKKK